MESSKAGEWVFTGSVTVNLPLWALVRFKDVPFKVSLARVVRFEPSLQPDKAAGTVKCWFSYWFGKPNWVSSTNRLLSLTRVTWLELLRIRFLSHGLASLAMCACVYAPRASPLIGRDVTVA